MESSPALNFVISASRSTPFMRPCTRPTEGPSTRFEHAGAFFGGGEVDLLGLLDQRADPIGAVAFGGSLAQMFHDFVESLVGDRAGLDRLAARRAPGEARDVHVAIGL